MSGIQNKRKYLILLSSLLIGCASSTDYITYVEAQKSISRDMVVTEAARINALIEMTKSEDPSIRATGIMLLQQLQQNSKVIQVQPPKGPLGF